MKPIQGRKGTTRKETKTASSRRDAPQKPDRPHTPEQMSQCERQFRRPALPKLYVCRGWDEEYSDATQQ
jgi:hypothetical protein